MAWRQLAGHEPAFFWRGTFVGSHCASRGRLAVASPTYRHGTKAMSTLLRVSAVSKRFRGLVAVDRVSLQVPERSIFAVIGPNGAGKTTLFNIIAGAFPPDAGTVIFADERIDGLSSD